MEIEVIPAILSKQKGDLLQKISAVSGLVKTIQLDIMDGKFVPNTTVGLNDLLDLPKAHYEFHWMVSDPQNWISKIKGNHIHLVHIETISSSSAEQSFEKLFSLIKSVGGEMGLAINPETPIESVLPYANKVRRILVMSVHPGFSGQSYIKDVESKIRKLRQLYPKLDIEVDGGVNLSTAPGAYAAGANILAAASALFATPNIKEAIKNLKNSAQGRCSS